MAPIYFYLIVGVAAFIGISLILAALWRVVVMPEVVHVVQRKNSTVVYGKDTEVGNVFYKVPSWIPIWGVNYKIMPVSIFKIPLEKYRAYDSKKAPFKVDVTAFFKIDAKDAAQAAQRVSSFDDLYNELMEVLRGAVRKILASNEIEGIMTERSILGESFMNEVKSQVSAWGVNVLNIEFMDISDDDSSDEYIITAIMKKHSSFIQRKSQEEVAVNEKEAKLVQINAKREADVEALQAQEVTEKRDAERLQQVGIANEKTNQSIQQEKKMTMEKEMAVLRVEEVEAKKIEASARVEEAEGIKVSNIRKAEGDKEAQALDGKGLGERAAAIGEGEATAIKQKGFAEADAKERLADALSRFEEQGLMALLGEKYIEKDKDVGVAIAKAYEDADMKVIQTGNSKPKNLLDMATSVDSGAKLGGMLDSLKKTLGVDVADLIKKRGKGNVKPAAKKPVQPKKKVT